MERKAETAAVKRALARAGVKARVTHGTGTTWGWLYVWVRDANGISYDRISQIVADTTGRGSKSDPQILVQM